MQNSKPVLKGFCVRKIIKVWCSNCSEWHIHGLTPDIQEGLTSPRRAHCKSVNSPYKESWYLIQKFTFKELEDIRNTDSR
jgi:hypothetical protein